MVESLFRGALRTLGVAPSPAERAAYARLDAMLREPGRAYHGLGHVEKVLETFLALEEDLAPEDTARATLALCYHDAVYDPRADDNENRSAAFARAELTALGIEEGDVAEVERLVLATKEHAASDPLSALVVDADLSILAAPPEAYDAYAAAIRREYAHVPDEAYRAGRTRVLEGLMGRRLFTSPRIDEEAARANLAREIERLRLLAGVTLGDAS